MHLSSLLKQHGHDTKMVVASHEDPLKVALEWRPDVLGYSVYTGTQSAYIELNRRIKSQLPEVLAVFGGPHPTFFPEVLDAEGVDGVCVGEGEYATLDLLNALQEQRELLDIANWRWKKPSGETVVNALRPLLSSAELDALPFPDRELVYRAHPPSSRRKIRPFITGRGCPYNCSFCFNKAFAELYAGNGARTRRRSVDNVLREIGGVRDRYGLDFVTFFDDTFILNRKWLEEFADKYPAKIGLPWWAQARADLLTEERVRFLRRAGCTSVSFGLESGSDEARNILLRRHMSREQILEASARLRREKIAFSTNNMVGLPMFGLAADLETLDLNIQCAPDYANCFLYQPYPKTELGELAQREGLLCSFEDLSGSVTDHTPLRFAPGEKRQIENLQKLFSIGVEHPRLVPVVRKAIELPQNPVFWLVYKLWKGFALKRRIFPYSMSWRETLYNVFGYMRIRTQ